MASSGGWPKEWKDEVARRGGSSSQQCNLQFVSCTGQAVSLLLDQLSAGLEEVRTGGGRAWTCFVCMCGSSRYVSWGGHVAARACSGRRRSFEERREIQRAEREAWRALEGQMRPGVAADPDSLEALIGAIVDARARSIERLRAELDEFATFLNPVQRAQLLISMERLQRNAKEIIRRR